MKITFDAARRVFLLSSTEMTYAFAIVQDGRLVNLYWGAALRGAADLDVLLADMRIMNPGKNMTHRAEYRSVEPFDYSAPCLRATLADGAQTLRLRYVSHTVDGDCLSVLLRDTVYPIEVTLVYQTWGDLPLIGRSAVICNTGSEPICLDTARSGIFHLPGGRNWRVTHFTGQWGAEYQKNQTILTQSRLVLENSRLTAAAAESTPFFALDEDGKSTETMGEVYFGALRWSGDYQIILTSQYGHDTDVVAGVSDETSRIALAGGESFTTPGFVGGYSNRGFEHMSEILYDWQFDYTLPRGDKKDKAHGEFPIIYNSWYPYEFDVDEERLVQLIPKAAYAGAELFVIDDGWMKGRINEKCGLGDWVVDPARFPNGLGYIADEAHRHGMMFGIWVEPEMVDPDSDLYRAHPDWILCEPNRERTLSRNQCVLDMSRDDITDWVIDWLDRLIIDAKLDYLKWDMNRYVSETGLFARERAVAVKYMRNIERIWKHLNQRFPDLLLENCASGGGRADFGMAPYADRINRSDNADPVDVMVLHEGFTTLFVPKLAGGAGNIAPSPSHQNGRVSPLDYRIHTGMTGSMSIGINLLKSPEEELERLHSATAAFKQIRPALHDSYVYRIASATEHPYAVFEYCKRDRSQFTVFAFGHGMRQWDKFIGRFRMRGLVPDAVYTSGSISMTGAALMNIGLSIPMRGDYASSVLTFKLKE